MTLWVRVPRIKLMTYKDVCVYWSLKQFCVLLNDGDCVVLCFIVRAAWIYYGAYSTLLCFLCFLLSCCFSFSLSHSSFMCFFFQAFLLCWADKPVNSLSFYSHNFLLLLWPFSPLLGHGLPFAGASRELSFHEVRMSVLRPTPNPEGM